MNETISIADTISKLKTQTDIHLDILEEKVAKLEKAVFEEPMEFASVADEKEDKKGILSKAEKEYLGNVIRPFRNKVDFIMKIMNFDLKEEYILISCKRACDCITLPNFNKGTMYKGMKEEKQYTVDELGL